MEQNQALRVLINVAIKAQGNGLFKTFEEATLVSNAIKAFQQNTKQDSLESGDPIPQDPTHPKPPKTTE